jgi:hypothetical protein
MAKVLPTREFLEKMMDNYMESLVKHDPSILPLSNKLKRTENTIALKPGDGLWATASDLPTYKLYVSDPQGGQVGFYGFMKENGFPMLIASRLKIEKEKITEIEDIVVRDGGGMPFVPENLKQPRKTFLEALKPEEKVSREEMVRISDLYFDALEQDNGNVAPFTDACNRHENSMKTTNNEGLFAPVPGEKPRPKDCRGQISSGNFAYITSIQPRRWTVVDEERGITFGTFMFQHTGTVAYKDVPGIGRVEMIPIARRPFTVVVSELFKVVSGQISEIEAVMTSLPYGAGSGWDK